MSAMTAMFSRFLKVAIATSNFMNKVYNGKFPPQFRRFAEFTKFIQFEQDPKLRRS